MQDWTNFIFPKYKDKRVDNANCFRMIVARKQLELEKVSIDIIIEYCKDYLKSIGMKNVCVIKDNLEEKPINKKFYSELKDYYKLNDEKDIIWMKFTKEGYLGVVVTSNDINFSTEENTSGKIITMLEQEWDESYVVIIPLNFSNVDNLNRQRVESGLGNYLISKGVPILDYFSHNL